MNSTLGSVVPLAMFLPKGGEGYVWAEKTIDHQIMLLHIALKYNALKENIIVELWLISFIDVFGYWILDHFHGFESVKSIQ